jgi:autotransporter strand-loop-strand O-heptosyltransferase
MNKKFNKAYVLYASETYFETAKSCVKSIRAFSDLPIIVYLLNSDKVIDIENVITIRFNHDIVEDQREAFHFYEPNENFYINRNNNYIYNLLIQRPLIVKDALIRFADTVAYVDSDSVATFNVDRIFELYDETSTYPYFTEGLYDWMFANGRGDKPSDNDYSDTLEHPICELFNINQLVRECYVQTGYFVAGQQTIDFLDEWFWMCNHPTVLKNQELYAPYNEETVANALLWKYNYKNRLPYIYVNGSLYRVKRVLLEMEFTGEKEVIDYFFVLPKKKEDVLFFHNEKRPKIMDEMTDTLLSIKNNTNNKTKILFLAPHLSTGGMPAFLLKRLENIVKYSDDIEPFVVEYSFFSDVNTAQRNKILKLIPQRNFWSLGGYSEPEDVKSKLIDIINNNNIDIVHIDECIEGFESFNKVPSNIIKKLYAPNRKWKIVETCHNSWFDPKTMKKYKPDAYAFCSPYHNEVTFASENIFSDVIQYPITNQIKTNEEKINAKNKLNFDLTKTHVLNVGIWTSGKNQKEGIEVAKLLEKTNPNLHFHFVGSLAPNFEEYWSPIINDLPSNVTVWNERADVDLFMTAADIFMFNSTWECSPIVIREALSFGLPVLAKKLPQYLNMFDYRIITIDDDINNIAKKIKYLSENKIIQNQKYDTNDEFANKHIEFYNNVLKLERKEEYYSDTKIIQNFVYQPFFEFTGDPSKKIEINVFDNNKLYYSEKLSNNSWIKLNKRYYTDWVVNIFEDGNLIYVDKLSLKNTRVLISFASNSLGDTIAWIPYCLEFMKKHNCTVIVSTFWNKLFKDVYPELEFVEPGSTVNNLYAMYTIGWFYDSNLEPELPNTIPLQKAATNILGLDYTEIKPRISFNEKENPYNTKYITIATNSTAGCKFWVKDEWQKLINYFNDLGYKIINVSKEENVFDNCENLSDTSIENTMNVIHHSELFIGLSSGLSWLAWVLNKTVVMISNFTNDEHEFKSNCIRITNKNVCNGCWNNSEFRFDRGDWNWCPIHKGTERQFECHKSITSNMVITEIIKNINL